MAEEIINGCDSRSWQRKQGKNISEISAQCENIGLKITNNAGSYVVEEQESGEIIEVSPEKMYIEVVYRNPQEFRFYNNREWSMNNVGYLLYCITDGSLWYGPDAGAVTFYASYKDDEHPFSPEEGMITEVINWYRESTMIEE